MISNTAQVNTFLNGMNLDSDVAIIPDSQYRYAENVRVVTNDEGTYGVLQNIEGVKKYDYSVLSDRFEADEKIVGTTTIGSLGIVATVQGTITRIYRIENFDSDYLRMKVILKGELGLCQDEEHPTLSIVGNYESNNIIKIYFTDGNSSIKTLNVVNGKYSAGSSYVDADGNILDPTAIDLTPGALLPPFEITGIGTGSLPTGVVQYCYQLFNLYGTESTLSAMGNRVHLTQSTTNQGSLIYEGSYPNTSSGKSVSLSTPLYSKDFTHCRIISIRYITNNSVPQIVIVDETALPSGNTLNYTDTGNRYMGEISVEEFNNLTGYQFKASTIETMQNRLFAANITEDSWDPGYWDARAYRSNYNGTVKLDSANSDSSLTFTWDEFNSTTVDNEHDCINPFNSAVFGSTSMYSDRYVYSNIEYNGARVLGGHGTNVDYHFITVPIKLSETQSNFLLNNDCSMNVNAVALNKFSATHVGMEGYVVPDIEFGDNVATRTPNYADPYIASHFLGYTRDEIYRFGIIFYNEKHIPSPVYWIGDIRMPHASQVPPFEYVNNTLYGRALGIYFTVKNYPARAVSYEIVRCDRTQSDRTVLMQTALSSLYNYRLQETDSWAGNTTDQLETSVEMRPAPYLGIAPNNDYGMNIVGERKTEISGQYRVGFIDPRLAMDGYYKLISPEICNAQDQSESYFNSSAYLDFVGRYYTQMNGKPIATTMDSDSLSSSTLTPQGIFYATPSYITNMEGEKVRGYTSLGGFYTGTSTYGSIRIMVIPVGDSSHEMVGGYAAIGKYYYPMYDTLSINSSYTHVIADAKYPPIIPYNMLTQPSAYKINVGEKTYTNISMSTFHIIDKNDTNGDIRMPGDDDKKERRQPILGPAGPCIIANIPTLTKSSLSTTSIASGLNTYAYMTYIPVANVKVINSNVYGGDTYTSRQNSIYITTNSYTVIKGSETDVHATNTFGGDTFLGLLDYPNTFTFQLNDAKEWMACNRFVGAYIPFESSINTNLFNGDMAHRTYDSSNYIDSHMQMDITQKQSWHVQDRPYFVYNSVYSTQNGDKQYVPKSIYSQSDLTMTNRILVSQAKTANEVLDNWSVFKVADYLDVEHDLGDITNLVNFNNRLFYFQDSALGVAAVNERALVDAEGIGQLTLGTGGVLARYDYVTKGNGSSVINDRSITTTANAMYWYDTDKNVLCRYTQGVEQLSKSKTVLTYLNALLDNSNVSSFYDNKYNEVQFKFGDKSLVFNEQIDAFTSFYTFSPDYSLSFSDKTVVTKNNEFYLINLTDATNTDTISKDSKLSVVVNKDIDFTKTFDNVRFQGKFLDSNGNVMGSYTLQNPSFETKHQVSTNTKGIVLDYREDTYRFAIPRLDENEADSLSFPARLRGKYLLCNYEFNADDGCTFKLPSITTTYRYSLV